VQHLDCGAIKSEYDPADEKAERQHNIDIIKAAQLFFAQYAPGFKFSAYFQDFDNFEQII
jgi:hypothetical protein